MYVRRRARVHAPGRRSPGPGAGTGGRGHAQPGREGSLPESFTWSSSGPEPDAGHPVLSVEDPTAFRYQDRWHVYFTTADTAGRWTLGCTSFARWSEAASAPRTFLDAHANIGNRYAAAPQVLYFAPQRTWYTVHQTGPNRFDLFEAGNVCTLGDGDDYLVIVEALATGSDWRRCFRAWTADSLGGTWKPPADTEANPFARSSDVAFEA